MTQNPITDGETITAPFLNSVVNAHNREGIVSGATPTKGTGDYDVDIASGTVQIENTTASIGATTVTLTTPASDGDLDAGEARVDIITVDNTGTVSASEGTASSGNKQAVAPDIPSGEALIAVVYVDGDGSSLTSAEIRDRRNILEELGSASIATDAVGDDELNRRATRPYPEADTSSFDWWDDDTGTSESRGIAASTNNQTQAFPSGGMGSDIQNTEMPDGVVVGAFVDFDVDNVTIDNVELYYYDTAGTRRLFYDFGDSFGATTGRVEATTLSDIDYWEFEFDFGGAANDGVFNLSELQPILAFEGA